MIKKTNSYSLKIPTEHPVFPAHFPENPILPGALLLEWIINVIEKNNFHLKITEVKMIKFLHPVRPGNTISLECSLLLEKNTIKVIGQSKNKILIEAKLLFSTAEKVQ